MLKIVFKKSEFKWYFSGCVVTHPIPLPHLKKSDSDRCLVHVWIRAVSSDSVLGFGREFSGGISFWIIIMKLRFSSVQNKFWFFFQKMYKIKSGFRGQMSEVRGPPNSELPESHRIRYLSCTLNTFQKQKISEIHTMHVLTRAVSGNALNILTRVYVDWMKKS